MAISLVRMVIEQLSPEALGAVAKTAGTDPASAERATAVAVPAIVAGLVQRSSEQGGASQILSMLKLTARGPDVSRYAAMLKDGQGTSALLEQGRQVVSSLFGTRAETVTEAVAMHTGLPASSMKTLLCLLSPFVAGHLAKHVAQTGTDAQGLASMLSEQSSAVSDCLPGSLGRLLGVGRDRAIVEAPSPKTGREIASAGSERTNGRRWLVPLGLGALAVLAGLLMSRGQRPPPLPTVPTPEVKAPPLGGGPATTTPGLDAMDVYLGTPAIPGQMKNFVIEGVTFATASADLDQGAQASVDRVAKALNEHPRVRVRVEGHTDNEGDATTNRKLSADRAARVKDALVAHGVDAKRIETAGLGPDKPKTSNETPTGRAENRRIEIVVLER